MFKIVYTNQHFLDIGYAKWPPRMCILELYWNIWWHVVFSWMLRDFLERDYDVMSMQSSYKLCYPCPDIPY